MNVGEKIRQARKEKGIGQDALAEQLGLSVQAVSKWECGLSCPDIALLPEIADYLEVTLDHLLRDEQNERKAQSAVQLALLEALPDDDTLRIVQCIGRKIVSHDEWNRLGRKDKIPLYFDKAWEDTEQPIELHLEIWGSADIEGEITGNVNAGGSVNCDCVGINANAGGTINCDSVGHDANAGGTINCDNVGNNVSAGSSVTCGNVEGSVSCEKGEIHCQTIKGDVLGGNIFVEEK